MKKLYDIKYGKHKKNLLDIYIPDKNNFKTVVWIHGSGLEEGDYRTATPMTTAPADGTKTTAAADSGITI